MSKYTIDYLRNSTRVGDVQVSDTLNTLPWTARVLGLGADWETDTRSLDADGNPWLFPGAVPLTEVRRLFGKFTVESRPLSFVREYREGDKDREDCSVVNLSGKPGEKMTVVTDYTRQILSDARTDRVHSIPSEGYSYSDPFATGVERVARIVGESTGDLHVDSVGVLAHGGEFWVSISTRGLISTPEGVDFHPHILAAGSCNGTLTDRLCAVNTLAVCDNTVAAALGEGAHNGTMTKVKHTRYSAQRLARNEDEARDALGLIVSTGEEFAAEVARLCAVDLTDSQRDAWTREVSGIAALTDESTGNAVTRANNAADVLSSLRRDARVSPWDGTAFGALQLANVFDLWERGTRGDTDAKARIMREAITGTLAKRETERADALRKVLATV